MGDTQVAEGLLNPGTEGLGFSDVKCRLNSSNPLTRPGPNPADTMREWTKSKLHLAHPWTIKNFCFVLLLKIKALGMLGSVLTLGHIGSPLLRSFAVGTQVPFADVT